MKTAVASLALISTLMFAPAALRADGGGSGTPLTRDEITTVKRKLQAIVTALGTGPAGYEKSEEDFNLPTETWPASDKKGFHPVSAGVQVTFDGGQARLEQEMQAQGQDMQQKMQAAMAAGDYEAIAEMQQKMVSQMQAQQGAAMAAGAKGRVRAEVSLNGSSGAGVDPDNIVVEKPGVLGLKEPGASSSGNGRVTLFFDPVKLAKTNTVSRVELRRDPAPGKTPVQNVVINITGPAAAIEAWAKKIATDPVLAQIDR